MEKDERIEVIDKDLSVNNKSVVFRQILITCLFVFSIFISFYMGYTINSVVEKKEFKVFLENEEQIFRDEEGHKIYPIKYKSQMYMPISGIGSYLGYMPVLNENLYLYKREEQDLTYLGEFKTFDLEGREIDEGILKDANYTIFLLWATWCPDCNKLLSSLPIINDYINESKIQLISIPTDLNSVLFQDDLSEEDKNKILELTKDIDFKYTILLDKNLRFKLVGNAINIPKFVIVDNQGKLVKIIEDNISGDEILNIFQSI